MISFERENDKYLMLIRAENLRVVDIEIKARSPLLLISRLIYSLVGILESV